MPSASASYRVVIVTKDRVTDADSLRTELLARAPLFGGGRASFEVTYDASVLDKDPKPSDPTTVAVFLSGGVGAAKDSVIQGAAAACLRNFIPALPVYDPSRRYESQVPPLLLPINGSKWSSGDDAVETASKVLKFLGLAEEDRRIFISYRQTDAAPVADQLRANFINSGWDVFLDRFSIPPGVNFQERLDRELADKAFVFLLETPDITNSKWVEHEIAFALYRKLGILALTLPNTTAQQLHPAIQQAMRIRLNAADMVGGSSSSSSLTPAAIEKIILEVDQRHSEAFTLRRESAMLETSEEMRREGYDVRSIDQWGLMGDKNGIREVALVTARSPEPSDLRKIDALRLKHRQRGILTRGWVVHPTEDVDFDRASLLEWLTTHRRINSTPIMLLAERLRA